MKSFFFSPTKKISSHGKILKDLYEHDLLTIIDFISVKIIYYLLKLFIIC